MQKQLKQMRRNPRLIVGTPGRINDHLKRKTLRLNNTTFLVLDESDRMLDMGFTPQINQVLETVPKKHQTLLFSATLPDNILRLAEKYLNQPIRISVGSISTPIKKINLMDQSKVDENCTLFSLANRLDNLGKITVAIAIAKIPKGSCINRSET